MGTPIANSSILLLIRFAMVHVGYTGPHKHRVSRNLISTNQQPTNLCKEISLGRVARPCSQTLFLSTPQSTVSPCGHGTKKHSLEWHTIYHLSFPEGDSINDYIPRDPYALQYVRVDNAIHILKCLGLGPFMAKTDLISTFRLTYITFFTLGF